MIYFSEEIEDENRKGLISPRGAGVKNIMGKVI